MRVRRDIASVPARSARETWATIVNLVCRPDSVDRQQLDAASSLMESIIADELPARIPIVFKGSGPRVLIYCRYQEAALEAGMAVDRLTTNPTAGDWRMTAPCEVEDVHWMNQSLASRASRLSVHDVDQEPGEGDRDEDVSKAIEIDWETLNTP